MFRPKLDHKYFTSETYWTKWNYLSKWDSNSMKSKDIVVDGINKNPSITQSYEENQFSSSTAKELTIIIDLSKCETGKYLGFANNMTVNTLNIILLNYTDKTYPRYLIYRTSHITTINITAYDSNCNKLDKIKYSGYILTESDVVTFNAPTLVPQGYQDAMVYNTLNLRNCTDIDLSECTEFSRIYNCGLSKLPFKNVGCNMWWGSVKSSTSGSLMPNVTEEEWARWFREDLQTVTSTKTLVLCDNLSKLSDATKKIATDKGWTLA